MISFHPLIVPVVLLGMMAVLFFVEDFAMERERYPGELIWLADIGWFAGMLVAGYLA